jgi:tetratricopeptide (TPR) repeat protein
LRAVLLLSSAVLGAAIGSMLGDGFWVLAFALGFPGTLLAAAWTKHSIDRRRTIARERARKGSQLALLDEVCRSAARHTIRERYHVEARYALQYDADSAQRELLERVTSLYRAKDNAGAEALLKQANELFGDSPYVAARHARMLLQDLRIDEARRIIEKALRANPDEISLLILRDGVSRADTAGNRSAVTTEIQTALAEMVEWAGMQLELIVGRTGAQLREKLGVVVH